MDHQLTPHFTFEELTQVGPHLGIDNDPPVAIAGNLVKVAEKCEQARAILGVPIRISYGYRCEALNLAVGGSETSAHMLALAADMIPDGMDLRVAWDKLAADPSYCADVDQLIIERGCVHVGLAIPLHGNIPRHELRLDSGPLQHRAYPIYGFWTPTGVRCIS
jgi:hypothetical protein